MVVRLSKKLQKEDGTRRAAEVVKKYFGEDIDTGKWLKKKNREVLMHHKSKHATIVIHMAKSCFTSPPWLFRSSFIKIEQVGYRVYHLKHSE